MIRSFCLCSVIVLFGLFSSLQADEGRTLLLSEEQKAALEKEKQEKQKYRQKVIRYTSPYASGMKLQKVAKKDTRKKLVSLELQNEIKQKKAEQKRRQQEKERRRQEKIAQNFVSKTKLQKTVKKEVKVKVVQKDVGFFDSLKKEDTAVDME